MAGNLARRARNAVAGTTGRSGLRREFLLRRGRSVAAPAMRRGASRVLHRRFIDHDCARDGQWHVDGIRSGGTGHRAARRVRPWPGVLGPCKAGHRGHLRRNLCTPPGMGKVVARDDVCAGGARADRRSGTPFRLAVADDVCADAMRPPVYHVKLGRALAMPQRNGFREAFGLRAACRRFRAGASSRSPYAPRSSLEDFGLKAFDPGSAGGSAAMRLLIENRRLKIEYWLSRNDTVRTTP